MAFGKPCSAQLRFSEAAEKRYSDGLEWLEDVELTGPGLGSVGEVSWVIQSHQTGAFFGKKDTR